MKDHSIVKQTLSYIEDHLSEDLTLDKIAGELHYSKSYISRAFLTEAGCTLYQYIRERRITEAARKLAETDLPIVEIAYEAHYNSQQAFTLAFHKIYLCTPKEYRKRRAFDPIQPGISMRLCFPGYELAGGELAA